MLCDAKLMNFRNIFECAEMRDNKIYNSQYWLHTAQILNKIKTS